MSSILWKKIAKRFLAVWLLAAALPALAVEGSEVKYVGGTVPFLAVGTVGRLDMTNEAELRYVTPNGVLSMPYTKIDNYQYSQEFTHNLGKLTGAAVSVVRHRKMRHFFRISFRDEHNVLQSAIFEVPKHMPSSLSATLETRSEGLRRQSARIAQPGTPEMLPTIASEQ